MLQVSLAKSANPQYPYQFPLPVISDFQMIDGQPSLKLAWLKAFLTTGAFFEHSLEDINYETGELVLNPKAQEFPYRFRYFDSATDTGPLRIKADQLREWHDIAVTEFIENKSNINQALVKRLTAAVAAINLWEQHQKTKPMQDLQPV